MTSAIPRGQVQARIVARAHTAPGGLVQPADDAERQALARMVARDAAEPALVFPGSWWVRTGDPR